VAEDIIADDILSGSLDFISREARTLVLDSISCALHNVAGDLEGNTAGRDLEWFARSLFERYEWPVSSDHIPRLGRRSEASQWDAAPEWERELWHAIARACLATLPFLMSRVAHRSRAIARAVNTVVRAERVAEGPRKRGRRS